MHAKPLTEINTTAEKIKVQIEEIGLDCCYILQLQLNMIYVRPATKLLNAECSVQVFPTMDSLFCMVSLHRDVEVPPPFFFLGFFL